LVIAPPNGKEEMEEADGEINEGKRETDREKEKERIERETRVSSVMLRWSWEGKCLKF
jgi:hypothetical protein